MRQEPQQDPIPFTLTEFLSTPLLVPKGQIPKSSIMITQKIAKPNGDGFDFIHEAGDTRYHIFRAVHAHNPATLRQQTLEFGPQVTIARVEGTERNIGVLRHKGYWVDPNHRRRGIGTQLGVEFILLHGAVDWDKQHWLSYLKRTTFTQDGFKTRQGVFRELIKRGFILDSAAGTYGDD